MFMDSLSHSRQPSRSSAPPSKKACNGSGNLMTKTTYDDVFGGPPKFGAPTLAPRLEDYNEIFGGFHAPRATSIPVLDLPSLDEEEVFFDVRSSSFDYDEVFGGFDDLDFAVSLDQLVMDRSNGLDGDLNSSDEAWTPLETESVSEVSDHSGKNKSVSNRDSYESIDGHMEFNISYHRANKRSDEDLSTGITHVTQLDAVPAYTFLVDKTTPSERMYNDNPPLEVTDDDSIHMEFSGGRAKEKNLGKTMFQSSNGCSREQTFGNGHRAERQYGRESSLPKEPFITVSEISLRTVPSELPPPRRPPPPLGTNRDDSNGAKSSKTPSSDGSKGDSSPPFFDVEVDMSSSAAASAAAMKEVMERAEVKLKSAKELLERKRECVQSRKTDRKDKDGKLFGNLDGSSNINGERVHGACEKQENGLESSSREERQKERRKPKVVSDSLDEEKLFDLSRPFSLNFEQSEKIEGADIQKQATQFFELVKTDRSIKTSEPANYNENHEHGQREKGGMAATGQQQENDKIIKAKVESDKVGETEKKFKVARELHELEGNSRRIEATQASCQQKGHEKKVSQEVSEQREYDNKFSAVQFPVETEKKTAGADEPGQHGNCVKVSRFEHEKPMNHPEKEKLLNVPVKSMDNDKRLKGSREREGSERKERTAFKQKENDVMHKETVEQVEKDKKLKEKKERKEKRSKEILEQEEILKRQKEAEEREESERRMRDALRQIENEKRIKEECEKKHRETIDVEQNERVLKEASEQEENERKQREAWERGENEKKQNVAYEREQTENGFQDTYETEQMEQRLKNANKVEESSKRPDEVCDEEYDSKMFKEGQEREEYDAGAKKCFENKIPWNSLEETRVHSGKKFEDAGDNEDLKKLNKARRKRWGEENWKGLKMAEELYIREELWVSEETSAVNDNENVRATELESRHESHETVLETEGACHKENGKVQTEPTGPETEPEAVKTAHMLNDETSRLSGFTEDNLEHEEDRVKLGDEAETLYADSRVKARGEFGTDIGPEKTSSASRMASDKISTGKKFTNEQGERENNVMQARADLNQKESKAKFVPMKESIQKGRKLDDAHQSVLRGKKNTEERVQGMKASQSADRKEKNCDVKLTSEQKEAERIKRERELEAERLRKLEEEWEREREREKDRMAVDKATLEARERTYFEARERAEKAAFERASAEARNRAMTEARERLEKACAEAREKSLADKTSAEARLRAERAAVERATAEARERAMEKVKAERAAFEAKERLERTFSEKNYASSRNSSMRPTSDLPNQKFQSTGSFNSSRYHQYSSVYDASYTAERSEGVEGESAQRCKARLERHRRTAERAAKALAEKNMRDLVVQREQAERNRLAETLDADVKRWSSGKEGNLRALLSTLQYILGPESGWHPIPLTEVITSAAVKKAYRKATLCVHPDKLQQRGATIQQKYISEKVFDLLKEAWNKFNSEER